MATTTIASGCAWSKTYLCDGWGDGATEAEVEAGATAVVNRFEQLANEQYTTEHHTERISWHPGTSEVYGQYDGVYPDDMDLNTLREECIEYVFTHMGEFIDL